MADRYFSQNIQYQAVLLNLESNNGQLMCETCKKGIHNKKECHFDHIIPFSRGGKSILSNCQILCAECNLKKNNKEMHDFELEEKASSFVFGDGIINDENLARNVIPLKKEILTKEEVISAIKNFVTLRGKIRKIDFMREKNNLPNYSFVKLYWKGMIQMQSELGLQTGVHSWNRETILSTLRDYIEENGNIFEKELGTKNNLPSLPCILSHFPEFKNLSDVKDYFGIKKAHISWSYTRAVENGKNFIKNTNKKITEKDLRKSNNLPNTKIIYKFFGSLNNYQKIIGAEISKKNEFISIEKINLAVNDYFKGRKREIYNKKTFFKDFVYCQSVVINRYESVDNFLELYGIIETHPKKQKFSKNEVDKIINDYVKSGNTVPSTAKDLSKHGLPSQSVILRFYDNWKEPFYYFQRLYEKNK